MTAARDFTVYGPIQAGQGASSHWNAHSLRQSRRALKPSRAFASPARQLANTGAKHASLRITGLLEHARPAPSEMSQPHPAVAFSLRVKA
jgi:hypothetical protein